MKRVRRAKQLKVVAQPPVQSKLVLPEENSDDHPLMQKYAKISEVALKNPTSALEDDPGENLITKVG
jgi:hypothetical protein